MNPKLPAHPLDRHACTVSVHGSRYTYKGLRTAGWPALNAYRASKIFAELDALMDAGLAGVWAIPDDRTDPLDGVEGMTERDIKTETERIHRDGVWGLCAGSVEDGEVIRGDECWGFIGDDAEDPNVLCDFAENAVHMARAARDALAYAGFQEEG